MRYVAYEISSIEDYSGAYYEPTVSLARVCLKKLSPALSHRASTSVGSLPRDTSSTATKSSFGEESFEVVPISIVSFRYQHTKEGSRGFLYARQPASVALGG